VCLFYDTGVECGIDGVYWFCKFYQIFFVTSNLSAKLLYALRIPHHKSMPWLFITCT
jgi:hypothetical protein